MVSFKVGDKIICKINLGKIVKPSDEFDCIKDFEIISLEHYGYYCFVPEYYGLSNITQINSAHIKKHSIHKKFIDFNMIYIEEDYIYKASSILDGMHCNTCKEFFKYSASNQDDGSMKCWNCRKYR